MEMTTYTWETLATVSGATAMTLLIVQFIKKPLDRILKIPTRWVVWVIAFIILFTAHVITAGITWTDVPLVIINAFMVTLAAMGAYEATFSAGDKQSADGEGQEP